MDLEKSPTADHIEVHWEDKDYASNPHHFHLARKWVIVLLLCIATVCMGFTSSLFTSSYEQVIAEFDSSQEVATLGLSFFIAGLGLGPLFLAPLSEFFGRKPIYIAALLLYLIWLIPGAVANNMATLLVSRFLDGLSGSALTSVAGGTVGDLFPKTQLTTPMLFFTASPFWGAGLAPTIGGFINSFTTWRWSFYMMIIWGFIQLVAVIILVPETYHPVLLRRKAIRLRRETGDDSYKAPIELMDKSITSTVLRSCYRPFMLLTLEPMVLILCVYSAIILGIQYLFFGAFDVVFEQVYGFNLWQVGLSFIGMQIGMTAALFLGPLWNSLYLRLSRSDVSSGSVSEFAEPEHRLPPAIAGAPLITIGLFWFAWTTLPEVHWIVPIIGSSFYGIGSILVYSGVFTFLVDAYPVYAASALAANSFTRSCFAAGWPLFGEQMYHNVGNQWASSILAFISLAMVPFPFLFYRYGHIIRKKSRFASTK